MFIFYIISVGYFGFMVLYGFWAAYLEVTPNEPEPPPLNEPINIDLPLTVSKMEWVVLKDHTKLIEARDIDNNKINLN